MIAAFVPPTVDWAPLAPVLIVLGTAVIGVLLEAFLPVSLRRVVQASLAVLAVVAALASIGVLWARVADNGGYNVLSGSLMVDGPALVSQAIILVVTLLSVLVMGDRTATGEDAFVASAASVPGTDYERLTIKRGLVQTEVYPLVLFAAGGMMIFGSTGDLLTMFVALEVFSLPLYLLSGLARRRRLQSQEASLKYFLLGAFASALFVFGIALIYGYSGSLNFAQIAQSVATPSSTELVLLTGAALLLAGLFFKVGAVPFHLWTPDVYQGAPTPITGFMAAATKVAAFAAMLRVIYVMLPGLGWELSALLWTVAIATMIVGAVAALVQTDIKRLLAYSSIAHAGFVLIGVAAMNPQGPPAVMFYLLAYGLATVGAFAVVSLVRERTESGEIVGEATALSQWSGLGRAHPVIGFTFLLFLLSFAGIPLTAGFVGKFAAFAAAFAGGAWQLVLIAVLVSAAAAFAYIKVLVLMFFPAADSGPREDDGKQAVATRHAVATVVPTTGWTTVTIAVTAFLTVLLGVFPGPVLDALNYITMFLR